MENHEKSSFNRGKKHDIRLNTKRLWTRLAEDGLDFFELGHKKQEQCLATCNLWLHKNDDNYELDKFEYEYYSSIKEGKEEHDPDFHDKWTKYHDAQIDYIKLIKEGIITGERKSEIIEKYDLNHTLLKSYWNC